MLQFFGYVYFAALFSPPIFQLIFSRKRIKGQNKLSIGAIAGIAFLMSLVIPIGGMMLLSSLRPEDPNGIGCITGEVTGVIFFTVLNLVLTIAVGLVSWEFFKDRNAKRILKNDGYTE